MNNDNNLNQMPMQSAQQPMQNPNMMNNMQQPQQVPMNQSQMSPQPQNMNNMPPQKKNNNLIIIIIVAVIVIALAVIIAVAVTSNSKDDSKKNNNNQTEEKKENENKDNDKEEDKEDKDDEGTSDLKGDWKSMKFTYGGYTYTLMDSFSEFSKNGWSLKKEYLDGEDLENNYKTYTIIPLVNSKYSDSSIYVGLINSSGTTKKYEDCQVWGVSISNDWVDEPIDFSLPGGVKYGSTLAEVEAIYGKPEADNIYYSETLDYYNYTYETDDIVLELTIYNEKGLTEFDYKYYG